MTKHPDKSVTTGAALAPRRIEVVRALLGFEQFRDFEMAAVDDAPPFFLFQSLEDPEISFFLLPISDLPMEYTPRLPDWVAEVLDLGRPGNADLYALVSLDGNGGGTANLKAPLLIDPVSNRALQVVIDGNWPLRAPLVAGANEK